MMPAVGVILFLDRKNCFQGFVMYRDRTLEKTDVRLYAVTDRSWLNGRTLYEQVEEALQGGATMVQLREKQLSRQQFLEEARRIKKLCAAYHAPFIINDDAELCREVDADGVHVGQTDMAVPDVRAEIGEGRLIGVSARTVEQAADSGCGDRRHNGRKYFRPAWQRHKRSCCCERHFCAAGYPRRGARTARAGAQDYGRHGYRFGFSEAGAAGGHDF